MTTRRIHGWLFALLCALPLCALPLCGVAGAQPIDTRCIADGGMALCTAPALVPPSVGAAVDGDMWGYRLCDYRDPNVFRQNAWCTARGGDCGPVFEGDIVPVSTYFEILVNSACSVSVADTNWGQTVPPNEYCWSGSPIVQNGVVVFDLRKLSFSGSKSPTSQCGQTWTDIVYARRDRGLSCPQTYASRTKANGDLECWKIPATCAKVGNPISLLDGCKVQREVDYRARTPGGLEVLRYYNSAGFFGLVPTPLTAADVWRTTWHRRLVVPSVAGNVLAYAQRADGNLLVFLPNGREKHNDQGGGAAQLERLADGGGATTGWRLTTAEREVELYDAAGRLQLLTLRTGHLYTLGYDAGSRLVSVSDTYGNALTFTYDAAQRLSGFVAPGNRSHVYEYDAKERLARVTYPGGAVRNYHYENANFLQALTGITDESGSRYATWDYDTVGRAITSRHADGADAVTLNFGTFSTSANLGTTSVVGALAAVHSYDFQVAAGMFRVTRDVRSCSGCVTATATYTYDANGNVATYRDFNGNQTNYTWDLARNLEISRTEAAGTALARTITTQWDAVHRLPARVTMPSGVPGVDQVTDYVYDGRGNTLRKTITAGSRSRQWQAAYNALGQPLSTDGPRTDAIDVTTYTYYAASDACVGCRGNVRTMTNALGHVTTYSNYDDDGNLLSSIDPNGLVTTQGYDVRGRLTSRRVGTEAATYYAYDALGQLTRVTLPDGSFVTYTYDAAHRLTQITDGLGNRIVYTLDSLGNRVKEQVFDAGNALARTRSRTFDPLGRLASERGAFGQTTTFRYDDNGNRVSVTDPLGHATSNSYDALDRLTQVTDAAQGVTRYAYDAAGNLAQVTDPGLLATTYATDGLGGVAQQQSPDTGLTSSTFDSAESVQTRLNAKGIAATYVYDAMQRLTQVVYSKPGLSTLTHTFEYDGGPGGAPNAKGRLTRVTDAAAVTAWSYDSQGRVAAKSQAVGALTQTVRYEYTATGRVRQITTPSGQTIAYTYVNNRIASVIANGTTILAGAFTTPFGPVGAWQWGNGTSTFRVYDNDGRLGSWEFAGNGTSLLKTTLGYDAAGRVTALTDATRGALSQRYTDYDAADRLLRAETGTPLTHVRQYAYDANGNRRSATVDGTGTSYAYTAGTNRLSALSGAMNRSYVYNAVGNANVVGPYTYTYDRAERLVQVSSGGTVIAAYDVNALGQRVRKTVGGSVTHFVYDEQGRLLGEYDGSGTIVQETVWLDDLPVAILRPFVGVTPLTINIFYVHADHLGTPRAVTRVSDNVLRWTWDNVDPFGANPENPSPAGFASFSYALRFPGQYYDAETGMHYNYFRDYDPTIGRYVQGDPIGLGGGLNIYGYVGANPIAIRDPRGLDNPGMGSYGPAWRGPGGVSICSTFLHPHTFLCVDGNCSGKYPSGNPFWSPGEIRDDSGERSKASCGAVPPGGCDQYVFLQCVADRVSNRGPSGDIYNFYAANCGQWAEDVITLCRRKCMAR